MVLSSDDVNTLYPNNTSYDFRIQFNRQIQLDGYWVVALTEFTTTDWDDKTKQNELLVCSDICQDTFVRFTEVPLIRRVYTSGNKQENIVYNYPYYISVKIGNVQQMHIYIKDRRGLPATFLKGRVTVTLHFKKFPFALQ